MRRPHRRLGAGEPPQARRQHDCGRDETEARRREGCGAEEGHRDRVLNRRRARQRRHGERRSAEDDRGRHQATRDVGGAKQSLRHWHQDEEGHKQADAAVGDERARKDNGKDGALLAKPRGHEIRDGRHRADASHNE